MLNDDTRRLDLTDHPDNRLKSQLSSALGNEFHPNKIKRRVSIYNSILFVQRDTSKRWVSIATIKTPEAIRKIKILDYEAGVKVWCRLTPEEIMEANKEAEMVKAKDVKIDPQLLKTVRPIDNITVTIQHPAKAHCCNFEPL